MPHQNNSKTIPIPTKATLPYLNDSTDKSRNTTRNRPTAAAQEDISEIIKPIIQTFHEQYKQNIEIQHENELAREIRQIYCQVSVLRKLQAITLSQTNGISQPQQHWNYQLVHDFKDLDNLYFYRNARGSKLQ